MINFISLILSVSHGDAGFARRVQVEFIVVADALGHKALHGNKGLIHETKNWIQQFNLIVVNEVVNTPAVSGATGSKASFPTVICVKSSLTTHYLTDNSLHN